MSLWGLLETVITVLCLTTAVWVLVLVVRDRTPTRPLQHVLLGVEALLVVLLVVGLARLHEPHHGDTGVYVGYLIGLPLVLPVAVVWSNGEQTRGGTSVLLLALLVVPFMFVRLSQTWAGGG